MLRNTTFALLAVLGVAASVNAATLTYTIAPTTGVGTHSTAQLVAQPANPADTIVGFDFTGASASGEFGFQGGMLQVNPFGVLATVFNDNNVAFGTTPVDNDSQFKVLSTLGSSVGLEESANTLQAAFGYNAANAGLATNNWNFAQIAFPTAGQVNYRGTFTIRHATGPDTLEEVFGTIAVPEPATFVLLGLAAVGCLGLRRRS